MKEKSLTHVIMRMWRGYYNNYTWTNSDFCSCITYANYIVRDDLNKPVPMSSGGGVKP